MDNYVVIITAGKAIIRKAAHLMDQIPRVIESKYRTHCHDCGQRIEAGDLMWWRQGTRAVYGEACGCGPKRRAEALAAGRHRPDDIWPRP